MKRAPLWGIGAAVAVAMIALHMALPTGSLEQSLLYDLAGALAVVAVVVGTVLNRPSRATPWILIAIGQGLFVLGDVLWVWYEQIGESPFPSMADAFYLAGYPFMAAGLALFIRRRLGGGDRAGLVDAAILTTAAAMLMWAFVMAPALIGTELSTLELAITVAYPLGDILLIGVATGLLTTPGARTPSFVMVAVSLAALLVADNIYAIQNLYTEYTAGTLVDDLYLLSYAAIACAALHPSMRTLTEAHPVPVTWLGPLRLTFLAAAMLTGPALVMILQPGIDPYIAVLGLGTAVLSLLVLVRLAGLVRVLERDVAHRRVLEQRLSHQANHDPLTGVANRRLFITELTEALDPRSPTDGRMALLFVDLDRFKSVNDELGHVVGDAILRAVGTRIAGCLRSGDLAARLGGDEFGVLLRGIRDDGEADIVADRIIAALAERVVVGKASAAPGASIGIATAEPGRVTADELLQAADAAMYRAKGSPERRHRVTAIGDEPSAPPAGEPRTRHAPGMAAGFEGA